MLLCRGELSMTQMYLILFVLAVPLKDPEMKLKVLSPTELFVSWEPLLPHLARGTITSYKVQWKKKNLPFYNVKEVSTETFS